jgi:hypothetical protein
MGRCLLKVSRLLSQALLFVTTWFMLSIADDDSLPSMHASIPKTVLIVKNDSYLENTVSAILKDSLSAQGYVIKMIPPASLTSEQPSNYRATFIMNAIKASKVSGIVRSYVRSQVSENSNILICTVYGEEWKSGLKRSDAVTSATTTLSPAGVAAKILSSFEKIQQPRKPSSR